jgi:hypothetical protein
LGTVGRVIAQHLIRCKVAMLLLMIFQRTQVFLRNRNNSFHPN